MIDRWRSILGSSTARLCLAVLSSGFLLGIGFVFSQMHLYPLAFLGVALFVTIVIKSTSKTSAFFKGWGVGLILYILVFANIATSAYPIEWIGIENPIAQWLTIIAIWIIVSLGMGAGYGVLGWLIYTFRTNSWADLLTIPLMWVVCERLSVWFFSLVTLGQGTLFGGHFTLGFVGYLFVDNLAILQAAALGGIYLLSFLLVLLGVLIYKWWTLPTSQIKKQNGLGLFALFCLILIISPIYSIFLSTKTIEASADTLNVAIISSYVPASIDEGIEYWDQRHVELRELVAPLRNIDLLVFPESAGFLVGGIDGEEQTLAVLHKLNSTDLLVIDSRDTRTSEGTLRSVGTFYSYAKTLVGEKQFLVPFGEYLPYMYVLPMKILGQEKLLGEMQSLRGYKPGVNNIDPEVAGVTIAVRFCDEVLSPSLYREQVKNGANILVNMSSFSWFHGNSFTYRQIQNIAKVRAVENGRWYVQSGNMAPAFVLDYHGRVIKENEPDSLSVLKTKVPSRENRTLYSLIGR